MDTDRIRFARWDDMDPITEIIRTEFGPRETNVRSWMEAVEANLSLMLVYLIDGSVVGLGGLQFTAEDEIIFHTDCVAPEKRGKGIGRALVMARIAMLDDEAAPIYAGVLALEKNIPYYEKFGFSKTEESRHDPALAVSLAPMEREIFKKDIEEAEHFFETSSVTLALDEIPDEKLS
ncbi:GNAT family N-acetyltransferase [Pelagicoccus sp. SDUM812005]|uniref:GNAT family N-acetyltransferase n=1 Tax=Pelagicoccus sp. SDUM812005 TaxID=3041257 RepID=UPI00280F6531|nr:GNAT family N-acetyltransferase [Pelagicoccus sp. SDUM812005]MDQ8183877.1 GNAT family N-acetyltransferase [Pelagicoccus sp. SDUM812005]